MARGWESKSVESQQNEAAEARLDQSELTPEERQVRQKREGLELSRRRILQELESTGSEVRRLSLEQALAFLDGQLAELEPEH
jgi:hypothetical protein